MIDSADISDVRAAVVLLEAIERRVDPQEFLASQDYDNIAGARTLLLLWLDKYVTDSGN